MGTLDIQTIQTNTTEAKALLSYDQVVETLGMRIGIEGNLPANAPGTTTNLEWQTPADDGTPGAVLVHVVVDHNYMPPVVVAAALPVSGTDTSFASAVAVPSASAVVPAAAPPAPPTDLARSIAAIAGTPATPVSGS